MAADDADGTSARARPGVLGRDACAVSACVAWKLDRFGERAAQVPRRKVPEQCASSMGATCTPKRAASRSTARSRANLPYGHLPFGRFVLPRDELITPI